MRLLIVDDNFEMRKLIKSLVEGLADEVFECSDGSQVFSAYSLHQPDWDLMNGEDDEKTSSKNNVSFDPHAGPSRGSLNRLPNIE